MTIDELSEQTGVPVRTIRYYITENLLPHSKSRGRGADYTEEHVLRLRLVSELSRKNVPIARQREMLALMTLDQVRAELAEVEPPSPLTGAAYIQSLLDAASHGRRGQSPATTSTRSPHEKAATRSGWRASTRTRYPAFRSRGTSRPPRYPVAPSTSVRGFSPSARAEAARAGSRPVGAVRSSTPAG